MQAESAANVLPRYKAFISYSHADAGFAGWLHRRLEAFRLPKMGAGVARARLAPVFLDRAELSAGTDLSEKVRAALARSDALVVVASPAARSSRWVGREIALFRELFPDRPILVALLEGEPEEAFPHELIEHQGRPIEPLAADFRKGQDGRQLGLLKLVAGLGDLPLDQLVQRDAQARQRRVMAVTAAALLLSVVLATLLVLAMNARAEAERQRAEAEGLIEFMLTDLRERLQGVGRLDVMMQVNDRAMRYYADEQALTDMPVSSLDRRARVIEAMGGDDELAGEIDAAFVKYTELHRITGVLLAQERNDPQRILAHARAENRLAVIEAARSRFAAALLLFRRSEALLARLPHTQPEPERLRLSSYVSGNICAMQVKLGKDLADASRHCENAVALAQRLIAARPGDHKARYDLAFHYLWLGDAHAAAGNVAATTKARTDSLATSEALLLGDPANKHWREQHMEICFRLARIAREDGRLAEARRFGAIAQADNRDLVAHDPKNGFWAEYTGKIDQFMRQQEGL